MSRTSKRLKWSEQMNTDLLECKKKAQDLVSSDNSPLNRNGKKKGYIEVMHELWIDKGYNHLGLKSQNLRDQASRLEKTIRNNLADSNVNDSTDSYTNTITSSEDINENLNQNSEILSPSQYANSSATTLNQDLHMTNISMIPRESEQTQDIENSPGCLPQYKETFKHTTINWGKRSDGGDIILSTKIIIDAYDEIATWKKNVFLVPYGKIGRDFIDQITLHINDWNNGSERQHISLKAAFVLIAIGLQKPGPKSKAKDHKEILSKRLTMWKDGEIDKILREGRTIQSRIGKLKTSKPLDKSKIFAKLVLDGQINSALRFLSETSNNGVLKLTDEVMTQLKRKHPNPQPAKLGSLLFGPIDDDYPDSIYCNIDGEMVRQAALRTKGSGGPSGVDANGFRRILACKSFKQSSSKLCEAIATMTKTLCTQYIDPMTIEPLIASRLIPLDKGEGAVRPIGVGEVIRRICGKCVMNIVKQDVMEASGSLQLCAGQKSGCEAGIHAMHTIFEAEETDAVLLIDATNAFNTLNRATALHNIRVLCPAIALFAINTYRHPARLFIIGGKEIVSAEGTTQGDPIAMAIYALSLQPLIMGLKESSSTKQCWYADDASGAGSVSEIKQWWTTLNTLGPDIGYFPNAKKCWIIVKPDKEASANEIFKDTAINITTEGQHHLGAVIGSQDYLEKFVNDKITNWVNEITQLAEFARAQPQACYAAYTFGLKHRWTYFLRTLHDIQDLLKPLEDAISNILIPAITERTCSQLDRDILALPARLGGMGLSNPCQDVKREHDSSIKVTAPLVERIIEQVHQLPDDSLVKPLQQEAMNEKTKDNAERAQSIKEMASPKTQRVLELAAEKGSSMWLTVLPLQSLGFNLNKREFRDAVRLRYNWPIDDIPSSCVCGVQYTIDHAMICKRGGFIIQRHNELRDLEAEMLRLVCKDVQVEPVLQDISGEELSRGTNKAQDARLDIHARGFWEHQRSAFFDVRVCHPNADSYRNLEPQQIYKLHENEKKNQYASRVLDIEHGTFTPLVFTTSGGMGKECQLYHSRLAELIAIKKGEQYAKTISWIRARISFALLRSSLICLRGSRQTKRHASYDFINNDIDIDAAQGAIRSF